MIQLQMLHQHLANGNLRIALALALLEMQAQDENGNFTEQFTLNKKNITDSIMGLGTTRLNKLLTFMESEGYLECLEKRSYRLTAKYYVLRLVTLALEAPFAGRELVFDTQKIIMVDAEGKPRVLNHGDSIFKKIYIYKYISNSTISLRDIALFEAKTKIISSPRSVLDQLTDILAKFSGIKANYARTIVCTIQKQYPLITVEDLQGWIKSYHNLRGSDGKPLTPPKDRNKIISRVVQYMAEQQMRKDDEIKPHMISAWKPTLVTA